ncbi:MAG: hypothetical protein Rhirs2KO_18640 [Rhizobiaceae bacterium]
MLFAHLRNSFRETFEARASEWALAVATLLWGLIVLSEPGRFDNSRAYADFLIYASQETWGMAFVLIGAARLTILFFNGTIHRSPHLRLLAAFATCFLWSQIVIGLLAADGFTGLAMYPVALALDIFNTLRAAREAGIIDHQQRARKNGTDG